MFTPRTSAGTNGQGNDVSMMVSSGPYTLNAGDSTQVAFALIAGDSLPVLLSMAHAADVKFDSINGIALQPPVLFSISQNYPNPFKDFTTLSLTLSHSSNVNLSVFDVTGKKIMTAVDEKLPPGKYQYAIDGQNLVSGIYYYSVRRNFRCKIICKNIRQFGMSPLSFCSQTHASIGSKSFC